MSACDNIFYFWVLFLGSALNFHSVSLHDDNKSDLESWITRICFFSSPSFPFKQIHTFSGPCQDNHNRLADNGWLWYDDWQMSVTDPDFETPHLKRFLLSLGVSLLDKARPQLACVAQCYVTGLIALSGWRSRLVALIGLRSIQLRSETFWAAAVDKGPWKSKTNWEVPRQCAFAFCKLVGHARLHFLVIKSWEKTQTNDKQAWAALARTLNNMTIYIYRVQELNDYF